MRHFPTTNRTRRRRGVTLVEMLVSVALLVLMMSVIVKVFVSATSAVSAGRVYQELDASLRQLDSTIRQDLVNVTARFTPPLNPKDNLGYFEYAENSFADNQGEDADDTLRFTVKSPEGQYFTGRFWPKPSYFANYSSLTPAQFQAYLKTQPITVQSRYAEVIYFLRNGNLYRRVLLIAPELQSSIIAGQPILIPAAFGGVGKALANHQTVVSWLGVNDLSARPDSTGQSGDVKLNTLGDLTNRENRYGSPRFFTDYRTYNASTGLFTQGPDGLPDDENRDTVPDYGQVLYPGIFSPGRAALPATFPAALVNEFPQAPRAVVSGVDKVFEVLPFPFVFPGAYSKPVIAQATAGMGWIHGPDPTNSQLTLTALNQLNHNPIDVGDSLPYPTSAGTSAGSGQTWWGFPSWRETLSERWLDPVQPIWTGQPNGLRPRHPINSVIPTAAELLRVPFLPPMTINAVTDGSRTSTPPTPYRTTPQPNTDGLGHFTFASSFGGAKVDFLWQQSWEDDLIQTGVRSFDVKAYDDSFGDYVDLGWGNDLRKYVGYKSAATLATAEAPLLGHRTGSPYLVTINQVDVINPLFFWPPGTDNSWPPTLGASTFDLVHQTFAHEGRIPPRVADNRPDHQNPGFNGNLGDDNGAVIRLRRVWDSWSTDYSYAPANSVYTASSSLQNGQRLGPPNSPPVYPSYPPPYPMALRGLQIQIRVVDPRNERLKALTIHQDFSNKL